MSSDHSQDDAERRTGTGPAQMAEELLSGVEDRARAFVREQPLLAVLAAVSLGYCVARFTSRVTHA